MAQVSTGALSPRRVFGLVERLLDEPWSRFRAKQVGGDRWREHLGWGPAEYLQAALIDAVQWNTAVTSAHGSKKRPKTPAEFYRPHQKPADQVKSLAELDTSHLESLINL